MAQYTTKQAQEAYEEALRNGYGFNAKDAELIRSNPDSFMRIYGYKKGYLDAQSRGDKTAMENYNKMAEHERKQLGYTSGKYGAGVDYIEGPSSFQAPSFQYSQQDAYNQALGKITSRPDYANQYQEQYDNKLNEIMKPQNWNYNSDNDQAYQAAKKAYLREADRATANTVGQAAAANGGMVSTANTLAAQQAGDYYRSQLNDNLANFINADYGRYQDNLANKYNQLPALQNADAAAYQKYIDSVGLDFDTMNALMSDRNQQYGEYESGRNFDYGKYTDQLSYDTDKQATDIANSEGSVQNKFAYYQAMYEQTGDSSWIKKMKELESQFK